MRLMKLRMAVFIMGVFYTLTIFELSLRGIGLLESSSRSQGEISPSQQDSFNILCLGNSYTVGVGAPKGHAYCDYLKRKIEGLPELAHLNVKVFNLGVVSINTTQILNQLERNIVNYRPDLVLIMTGEPNQWNSFGYGQYLSRSKQASFLDEITYRVHDVLYSFRSFRFFEKWLSDYVAHANDFQHGPVGRIFPDIPLSNTLELGFRFLGIGSFIRPEQLTKDDLNEMLKVLIEFSKYPEGNTFLVKEKLLNICVQLNKGKEGTKWLSDIRKSPLHACLAKGKYLHMKYALGYFHLSSREPREAFYWYGEALKEATPKLRSKIYYDLQNAQRYCRTNPQFESCKDKKLVREMKWLLLESSKDPKDGSYSTNLSEYDLDELISQIAYLPLKELENKMFLLEKMRKDFPDNTKTNYLLCLVYEKLGYEKKLSELLISNLTTNPFGHPLAIGMLDKLRRSTLDMETKKNITKAFEEYQRRFPHSRDSLSTNKNEIELAGWIHSDLREMVRILDRHQVKFIFQSYPPCRPKFSPIRVADKVTIQLAKEMNWPLSNTLDYFQQLFKKVDREKYYSDELGPNDNHLNALGYEVLANFLFESIKKHGLFPPASPNSLHARK